MPKIPPLRNLIITLPTDSTQSSTTPSDEEVLHAPSDENDKTEIPRETRCNFWLETAVDHRSLTCIGVLHISI